MNSNNILNIKFDSWVYARLSEPFAPEELHYRRAFGGTNTKAQVLAYIDARTVADRLNYVVGADRWEDNYSPISLSDLIHFDEGGQTVNLGTKDPKPVARSFIRPHDGVVCNLSIMGVEKSDIGSLTYSDPIKGAASDALKRAAVKFGVGAYLYTLKGLWGEFDNWGKLLRMPKLPDYAVPVQRSSPRDAIMALIDQVRGSDLTTDKRLRAESIISEVMVMGSYNNYAPLVVTRAVYEGLTSLLAEADDGA